MWITEKMDDRSLVVIGGGWKLPPSFPTYWTTWIEFVDNLFAGQMGLETIDLLESVVTGQ